MSMELNAFTTLDFLLYGGLGVPQLRDPFLTMVQFKGNVNGDLRLPWTWILKVQKQ